MIIQAMTNSFLLDILQGLHEPNDTYRMALYSQDADLSDETTVYTTAGEVIGQGYGAGGQVLTGYVVGREDRVAFLSWDNPVWPYASVTARGALIYNFSKGNRAIAVLDLGKNFTSTNGSFKVTLPEPTAATALIQIGG